MSVNSFLREIIEKTASFLIEGSSLTELANNLANDMNPTSIATSAAGANLTLFNLAKETASKSGGIIGGMAGAVAGPGGVIAMSKVGSMVGGGMVQGGRNVATGLLNFGSNIKSGMNFTNDQGKGFGTLFGKNADFSTLAARRATMGK